MTTKPEDTALPTRRAMVGALAALPAANVPMLAHAAIANPDPIFALIEAAKRAKGPRRGERDLQTFAKTALGCPTYR